MIPNSENKRAWLITEQGFGYAFTCAALKAGDKVLLQLHDYRHGEA